jgi:hypothetical protein
MGANLITSFRSACISGNLQKVQKIVTENSVDLCHNLYYVTRILLKTFKKQNFTVLTWVLTNNEEIGGWTFIFACETGNLNFAILY